MEFIKLYLNEKSKHPVPEFTTADIDPIALGMKARQFQIEQKAKGITIDTVEAVRRVKGN